MTSFVNLYLITKSSRLIKTWAWHCPLYNRKWFQQLFAQVDKYEGSRSLDDLKNYLTLKISEHSLLSSATTENSESAEEIPSEASESDIQASEETF